MQLGIFVKSSILLNKILLDQKEKIIMIQLKDQLGYFIGNLVGHDESIILINPLQLPQKPTEKAKNIDTPMAIDLESIGFLCFEDKRVFHSYGELINEIGLTLQNYAMDKKNTDAIETI